MELLNKARITGTEPDEKGRVYSTQWSSIYDLTNPSLTLCADRDYDNAYVYNVDKKNASRHITAGYMFILKIHYF